MKRLLLPLLAVLPAFAQCPTGTLYPGALDTNTSMTVAKNNLITTLTVNQQVTDTVAIVASTTGWVANMMAAVDTGASIEYEFVTGTSGANTLNVSRACEGSTAVVHLAGAPVDNNATAYSGHTSVAGAIIATETALGANLSNIPGSPSGGTVPVAKGGTGVTSAQGVGDTKVQLAGTNSGVVGATLCDDANGGATTSGCTSLPAGVQTQFVHIQPNTGNNTTYQFTSLPMTFVADYNFPTQTPGGSLTVGTNTITLTPCPIGLNGTDSNHFVYISGGTGTAEAVLITGGTCTSQANSGTITFAAGFTHTGAWTVTSATNGAREAVISLGANGGILFFAAQTWVIRAQLVVDQPNIRFMGSRAAIIQAAANSNLQNVILTTNAATNFIIDGLTLDGNRANLGTTQNPGAAGNARNLYAVVLVGGAHSEIINCEIRLGQVNGIYLGDSSIAASDFKLTNNYIHDNGGTINSSGFGTGIYLNGASGTTISGVHIIGNHFENNYNTVTMPGPSGAVNGALTNDVLVSGNYAKNNFNVIGGQYVTGSTTGPSCGGNDTNWTVVGNTAISTTRFGGDLTSGVEVCGSFQTIAGNTFIGNSVDGVFIDGGDTDIVVTGNYINANGNAAAGTTEGINIAGAAAAITQRVVVTGNFSSGYTFGVTTGFASNNFINISGNQLSGTNAPLQDLSTAANVNIAMNMGALSFGVSTFNIVVGASPFTFTNGHFPESVAIFGGTVSSVAVAGTNFCTSTPCFLHLNPGEAVTITYTVIPTMNIINE